MLIVPLLRARSSPPIIVGALWPRTLAWLLVTLPPLPWLPLPLVIAAWGTWAGPALIRSALAAGSSARPAPAGARTLPPRWRPGSLPTGRGVATGWPVTSRPAGRWTSASPAFAAPLGGDVFVADMERLSQLQELAFAQFTPVAARDIAELQRTDSRPDELEDRVADLFEHPSHDPVTPLVNHDPDDRSVFGVLDRADDLRLRPLAVDDDATAQPVQRGGRRMPVEQRLVFLIDLVARVHDSVGNQAIVREQEQPFGLPVEPSDRHDALPDLDEIHDRVAPTLVRHRCDVAPGLVQDNVPHRRARDDLAVYLDLLPHWVNLRAKLGDDDAIHTHASLDD